MDQSPSYGQLIYQGKACAIYIVHVPEEETKKIRKVLHSDSEGSQEENYLKNELDITRHLSIEGVRKAFAIKNLEGKLILELEYVEGTTLKERLRNSPFTQDHFLTISIQMASILGNLHQQHILHNQLTSENILINNRDEVKFIDFGLAGKPSVKDVDVESPAFVQESLAYISPEQTGRLNQVVDERSDLYSLGVVFYEMLTGKLPFESNTPLELMYAHIAHTPFTPHVVNPTIPAVISSIVTKLLEKKADDRYQTCLGLVADLQKCHNQLLQQGKITEFSLGENDFTEKFQISQKLYGREKEMAQLLQLWEKSCAGYFQLLFISGYSGVGKTSLVQTLHKPITERSGYFVSGKFDQYYRNIPYYAWIQVFESFINQILSESHTRVEYWKKTILEAVGTQGKLLVDVVGNLEILIGKQPEVAEASPVENQNRFNQIVINFITAISGQKHPLFMFIDDWQWADFPSLELLKVVATSEQIRYLTLTGSYRDNEVDQTHPLLEKWQEIQKQHREIYQIQLSNLNVDHIGQLLNDTLHCPVSYCLPFTQLIFSKTQGNPFFVRQLLHSIHEAHLLQYNASLKRWDWNVEKIRQLNITDNVVEFMAGKILRMPVASQQVLKLASCIGTTFQVETLAIIYQKNSNQTSRELQKPLQEDMIISDGATYKFAHDRIQQAVYSLIPENERSRVHWQIGTLLLHNVKEQADAENLLNEQLFEIVNQLNAGKALISEEEESVQLATLNLQAGQKAKSASAFQPAAQYFRNGIDLLPPDAWLKYYELTFPLYEQGAECEFLIGEQESSEQHYQTLLTHARTALEKANILAFQVWQYISLFKLEAANQKAVLGLHLTGIDVPQTESVLIEEIASLEAQIESVIKRQNIHDFIDVPPVSDQELIVQMKNLYGLAFQTFYINQLAQMKFAVLQGVMRSFKYGRFDLSANMFAMYCRILASGDKYQEAYRFARLAIQLADANPKAREKTQVYSRSAFWGMPYGEHLSKTIPIFNRGIEVGWDAGDLVQSSANYLDVAIHMFHKGDHLKEVEEYGAKGAEFGRKVNFILSYYACTLEKRVAAYLQRREKADNLTDESFLPEQLQRINQGLVKGFLWFNKIQTKFWFEEYKEAYQIASEQSASSHVRMESNIKWADYHFYQAITCSQLLLATHTQADIQQLRQEIGRCYRKIKLKADACPSNFLHKQLLIEAELARLDGRKWEASELYDRAIAEAKKHSFTHIEALGNQLAAKHWHQVGKADFAGIYFLNARQLYQKWGAIAKVQDLEAKYPQYFIHALKRDEEISLHSSIEKGQSLSRTLDFEGIIRSIQAISGEMVLSGLLEKMMQYVLEMAGAVKGILIEKQGDQLIIQATGLARGNIQVLQGVSIEKSTELPLSIVQFVARTQKSILLDNALQNSRYAYDPYIQYYRPLSLLCFPILRKEKLMAIFYLENNLLAGVFSSDRLHALKILTTQMAISLENALLYENRLESEKKHEIEKAKSRFFENISHELRTPLTLILGPLERKVTKANKEINPEEYQMMHRNAHRLLQLINQLLDLSKLETGNMHLQVTPMDIRGFFENSIQSFIPLARQKNIAFSYQLPDELIEGYADSDKLSKIITNLLGNAFKFTPEQGQVQLEVSCPDKDGEWLQIRVTDTGPGMKPKELSRVFDRFYQTDTSQQKASGSGLGLALVKELVELHKGKISVNSEFGKGTEFIVDLPVGAAHFTAGEKAGKEGDDQPVNVIAQEEPIQSQSEKAVSLPGKKSRGKKQLLVVEDHPDLSRFMVGILSKDYFVSQARDGVEGLAQAIKEIPDLIISDIMMPHMDGYALCQQLKNDERTSHIPIILLTAKADVYSKITGLETGADDYLAKPFHEQELFARIKNLIRQREKLQEKFAQNIHLAPRELSIPSQDQRFLQKVMEITETELSNPQFGVEKFSQEIGMSRAQLYRKLHALTGFSPNEFLQEYRLKRAASLIENQFDNITQIAFETGFTSPSYFAKCFQQRFGTTPKAYSKSVTGHTKKN
ncbi:AAA family ATPase [Rhodocytophaga rosea]|uniref:histidine kinase n=1 Tax=Rhodocytophaga rosea TaxID=2704465 RepID=A0A6C0GT71_9BACT|nr:AAA family ATPase [Rhodocytophaga rosea]QHT70733.1 AAA family ATPase [Rhodocytophaga rosea]